MTPMTRRSVFTGAALGALMLAAPLAFAAEPQEIALWPGVAPGGEAITGLVELTDPGGTVTGVSKPTLILYRPDTPATVAMLVVAGGSFNKIVAEKEGHEIARWLNKNGIAAGVLIYRLPAEGWPADAMVQDAQRALRIFRKETGAAKTGILGFSAGGTIAAALDARAGEALYAPVDALDNTSAKPDFVGLAYAYLNQPRPAAPRGFKDFAKTPAPTFIVHAADDSRVRVVNSTAAATALKKNGGKVDLHVFKTGEHGFALRAPAGSDAAAWPDLFLAWLKTL